MNAIDVWMHIFSISIILLFSMFYSIYIIIYPNVFIITKFIALIILICTIYIGTNRNSYLPFLGYSAIPSKLLMNEVTPLDYTQTLVLNVDAEDDSRIIYWGAKHTKEQHLNPIVAYGDYSNSGIAIVKNNKATIRFNCPDTYKVGLIDVKKHIHYRIVKPNSAIISPVYTKFIECK